jgi:ATP phosphoribosyltransferase
MKIDHEIKNDCITVTITDTTADNLLDELAKTLGCDGFSYLAEDVMNQALEEIALAYIKQERPTVQYWHKDEPDSVNWLVVKTRCGRIHSEWEGDLDEDAVQYEAMGPEDFS